jgi:hypothetical protein
MALLLHAPDAITLLADHQQEVVQQHADKQYHQMACLHNRCCLLLRCADVSPVVVQRESDGVHCSRRPAAALRGPACINLYTAGCICSMQV